MVAGILADLLLNLKSYWLHTCSSDCLLQLIFKQSTIFDSAIFGCSPAKRSFRMHWKGPFELPETRMEAAENGKLDEAQLSSCLHTMLNKFESLANQLSPGWKYHISNTPGIKEAWLDFEDLYTEICTTVNNRYRTQLSISNFVPESAKLVDASVSHGGPQMSPQLCHRLLMEKVGTLAVRLSPKWIYHISFTDGIWQSWKDFEQYFQQMCAFDNGIS